MIKPEPSIFELIHTRRHLLFRTVLIELRAQFAGAILGAAWSLAAPVGLIVLFALSAGGNGEPNSLGLSYAEYIIYISAGVIAFTSYSLALTTGANSIAKDKQILLNAHFPAELIGLRTVIVSSVPLILGMFGMAAASLLFGIAKWTAFLVPIIILLQLIASTAIVWILSLATLAVKDLQFALQYLMLATILLTPIATRYEAMPPILLAVASLNPLLYFVRAYQDLLVFARLPSIPMFLVCTLGSAIAFVLSAHLFKRAKRIFFEYV